MTIYRENIETVKTPLNAWLMIVLFALMLLTPSLAQLFGLGSGSGENRTLAPFPLINRLKEIKDLPRMADAFVNDRFGLRHQLVHANSMTRYQLGLSSSKDVVIGKDGWLFYTADKILEQHTGANIFKPEELDHWVRQMERNRDYLAARGIAFFILVAPEKNTIYPENLPDYPRAPGAVTRMDQLKERLKSSNLEFIDPREALLDAKRQGYKVYYEGDTHWSQRGAFVAYAMLMDRVRKRLPDIVAKTADDYKITVSQTPAADLARLLTLEGDLKYTVENFELRGASHQTGIRTTSRDKWPWRVVEVSTPLANRPRLLVMGDSFTDYVLGPNFLYETFRDPIWTNHHLGNFNFSLLDEIKPQIVIYQFAERYLHSPIGAPIFP